MVEAWWAEGRERAGEERVDDECRECRRRIGRASVAVVHCRDVPERA